MAILEICVESIPSCHAAGQGGADRIELCEDLSVGGLTPNADAIAFAYRTLGIPVHVLIRPRAGGFVYSASEFAVMQTEINRAKSAGASGVVFGILHADGSIDRERTTALARLARPMSVTFHKAFDATADPFVALEDLIDLRINRILTSGLSPTARDGLALLAELNRRAAGRIEIMAGGRIRFDDLAPLLAAGLTAIHVGSGVVTDGEVDAEKVRLFKEAMRNSRPRDRM